jgi:hypothetical protein
MGLLVVFIILLVIVVLLVAISLNALDIVGAGPATTEELFCPQKPRNWRFHG